MTIDPAHEPFRGRIAPVPDGVRRPLWSVMIPTFNCAHLLATTLSSVLAAGYSADEMQIQVVDDVSTADDPEAVVRALGAGRVEFFRQPRNVGHARNFNTCLERSRGHLIHVLHGDDWVDGAFYQRMGALFDAEPGIGAAFCRHLITHHDGSPQWLSPLERETPGVLDDWLQKVAGEQPLQAPSIAVRRSVYEALGGFDTRILSCGEDWEMWVRVASRYPVGYHPELLAFYRDSANSLTKRALRSGQNIRDLRTATRIVKSYLPPAGRAAAARAGASWAIWALHFANQMVERGDYLGAAVQVREALLCDSSPGTLRQVVRTGRHGLRMGWRRVWAAGAGAGKPQASPDA